MKLHASWRPLLGAEIEKPYFKELLAFVEAERRAGAIFPAGEVVLAAFEACPLDRVKVVILGQDPTMGPGRPMASPLAFPRGWHCRLR